MLADHKTRSVRWLLPALLLMATALDTFAAVLDARAIAHEDLWLMHRVGAPVPSPDGRWLVVSVLEPSYKESEQISDLWLIASDGRELPRRLTGTSGAEAGATWSRDSQRLAFTARRDGDDVEQIYVLSLLGGDAQRKTSMPGGARSPEFSPDGRHLLFTSLVYPGARTVEENRKLATEREQRGWNARIYDGFPIRNWDRWLDQSRNHLFVLSFAQPGRVPAEPTDLLVGTVLAAAAGFAGRSANGGDEFDAIWSPDGESIVFAATSDRDQGAHALTNTHLYRVPRAGGEPARLTSDPGHWSAPRFSPDGRTLYAKFVRRTQWVYSKTDIAIIPWRVAGPIRLLTRDFDRSVSEFAVSPDSRDIYLTAEEVGLRKLFRLGRDAVVRPVGKQSTGTYSNLAIPAGTRTLQLFANFESASVPAEVVRIDAASGQHRTLAQFNAERITALDLPPVEHFWFVSAAGRRVHNLLVRPAGFDPGKKYPLVSIIHGGPHAMWGDEWVLRWNYHLLAAPGYVLLLTNYSGSTGFGEAFARHIQGDPLRGPGLELDEAANEAIRRFSFVDGTRQCAAGASYGGHLANWLQATSTRYRCLISHAGLINLKSQWGTSDVVYPRELNNGGPFWEQGAVWREQNPIRFADRFATPTLVTIGEQDFRVPLNNALEYWSVLQRRQIPSRLIVFPDENHWIQRGENSRLFYRELHAWLDRFLGDSATPAQ